MECFKTCSPYRLAWTFTSSSSINDLLKHSKALHWGDILSMDGKYRIKWRISNCSGRAGKLAVKRLSEQLNNCALPPYLYQHLVRTKVRIPLLPVAMS